MPEKMTEKEFRQRVCKGLNKRQQRRFVLGREKYNNDPKEINYKEEIEQEQDDIIIYQMMDFVANG